MVHITDHFNAITSHVIPAIIRKVYYAKLYNQSEVSLWGTGKATREFLYVKDLIKIIEASITKIDTSEFINVGNRVEISINDLFYLIAESMNYKGIPIFDGQINEYGYKRFVLIDAFRRLIEGNLPAGTTNLSLDAVKTYSAELYRLDGEISFARAELMGKIINEMSVEQKAYFDAMVGNGMKEWPSVTEPEDIRGLDRDTKVAVMTYAADLYSWYAGSIEADVYFCTERHGTYFGSFYLKDIKAMSDPTYSIPTNLTGDLGESMLQKLTPDQAQLITGLVVIQKPSLQGIVDIRRQ